MAFYHRYRPQKLADLSGQDQVVKLLQQAFLSDKLSHAYLFVGPRGSGKTSTARILAKMVNCETSSPAESPCNTCQTCLSITDGSNLDLIEIDAASNRGIEDIRALRETIKLSPAASRKKIYIIDEVHMLSNEAFNALLKTLEEPPSHALFILATTEADKIPQTIQSRSTRVDFHVGTVESLVQMLQKIVDSEKITIEPDALNQIARLSEGSFRDATKLLDQLASTSTEITVDFINQTLRISSFDTLYTTVSQLIQSDTAGALSTVNTLAKQSIPLRDFTVALSEFVRNLLMIKLGTLADSSDFSSEQLSQLQTLAATVSTDQLVRILNSLQNCLEKIKFTAMPQLALEVTIVELTIPIATVQPVQPIVSPVTPKPVETPVQAPTPSPEAPKHTKLSDSIVPADLNLLQDKWTYILETIKPHNFSLEAILRTVKLLKTEHDVVVLEAPYSFHQRIIESPKNRSLLEGLFGDVLSRNTRIQVVIGERPEKSTDIANVDLATDDEILRAAADIFNSDLIES